MIETSSAAPFAPALPGAPLTTVPADAGAEGSIVQDFSAVLAGAMAPAVPSESATLTTVGPGSAAIVPGNSGSGTGNTLPAGKLPLEEAPQADEAGEPAAETTITPPALALAFLPPILPAPAAASAPGDAKAAAARIVSPQPAKRDGGDMQASDTPTRSEHPVGSAADAAPSRPGSSEQKPVSVSMTEAPAAPRLDTITAPAPTETRNSPPGVSAPPANLSTPTQDLSALVDRIAEARAAAAPDTVRAALMHEEFGSVSLRFRADDSHIQVTLGSADPGFAPAVHAAAAASQSQTDRRDEPAHQRSAHDAQTNQPAQQQASGDGDARERGWARGAALGRSATGKAERGATPSEPLRRSGIYA